MQRRSPRTDALNQLILQASEVFASERRDLQAGSSVVGAVDLVNVLRCLARSEFHRGLGSPFAGGRWMSSFRVWPSAPATPIPQRFGRHHNEGTRCFKPCDVAGLIRCVTMRSTEAGLRRLGRFADHVPTPPLG